MEYFRRYLIFIRKHENINDMKLKVSTMALIASLVGITLGFLMDWLLPHEYFSNMFRGIVSLITGFALFSFSYLISIKVSSKRLMEDRYYKTVRKRFSYRQRVNFSIAVGVLVASFILLSSSTGLSYTLKASLAIFIVFVLVAFSRRNRSEFIKQIHEIPDVRDLETNSKRKKAAQRRKEKDEKKKEKKNRRRFL